MEKREIYIQEDNRGLARRVLGSFRQRDSYDVVVSNKGVEEINPGHPLLNRKILVRGKTEDQEVMSNLIKAVYDSKPTYGTQVSSNNQGVADHFNFHFSADQWQREYATTEGVVELREAA